MRRTQAGFEGRTVAGLNLSIMPDIVADAQHFSVHPNFSAPSGLRFLQLFGVEGPVVVDKLNQGVRADLKEHKTTCLIRVHCRFQKNNFNVL